MARRQYLEEIGIDCADLSQDEKAMVVSWDLFLELTNTVQEEGDNPENACARWILMIMWRENQNQDQRNLVYFQA